MMFTAHIDLGQIIIGGMIGIIGWFIKREITRTANKLDAHERVIQMLVGDVQYIVGSLGLKRRRTDEI